jgi:hypothetical protein
MRRRFLFLVTFLLSVPFVFSQSVIGVWRGKVSRGLDAYNMELKLVRLGDSLTGTSYYYAGSAYARFAIKGSIAMDGDVLWWDETLIGSRGNTLVIPNKTANLFAADFNCPGDDIMKLDGNAVKKDETEGPAEKPSEVHLTKMDKPLFSDEWDEVIGNYGSFAAQPGLIREIELTQGKSEAVRDKSEGKREKTTDLPAVTPPAPEPLVVSVPAEPKVEPDVEAMYRQRANVRVRDIPVTGDSILLRFYDHAEVDGDSIALFLNGKMLRKHVLLSTEPLELWILAKDLSEENDLTMVAENLGSIPPNTSLLIAYGNGVRYEAKLESTENTSATIRLLRKKPLARAGD